MLLEERDHIKFMLILKSYSGSHLWSVDGDGNIFPSKQFTYIIILVTQERSQSTLVNYLITFFVKHPFFILYEKKLSSDFRWLSYRNLEMIPNNTGYNSSETIQR